MRLTNKVFAITLVISSGIIGFGTSQAFEAAHVSARAGTLGLGVEAGVRIVPTIVVRAVANKYKYNYDLSESSIDYSGNLNLESYGLQADFHPPLIPFYATAGVFNNKNNFNITAVPSGTYSIGNNTYTGAQVGTLVSNAKFAETAYYGGLGAEFTIVKFAVALEGGVYYQGEPKVSMTASGPIATNPAFVSDLNRETADLVNKFDKAKYYPALTLMARYKF